MSAPVHASGEAERLVERLSKRTVPGDLNKYDGFGRDQIPDPLCVQAAALIVEQAKQIAELRASASLRHREQQSREGRLISAAVKKERTFWLKQLFPIVGERTEEILKSLALERSRAEGLEADRDRLAAENAALREALGRSQSGGGY